ncbi:BMP family ABC transporter substrate-binding protein [Tenuibacillus multivorans]|uniref:Transcriptional activator of comK protein n=1 Tax=Tenuibacillus multivorans TaxID=237069 RepID=A0A1G9ZXT5_9BACI|nr:BMP family ABC transporter substrate-binding protein [Tenuibacillus multivorans]GEL76891.1 transcriptional activator protein med [Tenuibacillus multivorans]SDN26078.1 transcriptional activator of comK gene [Tenuibacillus multivorans]
MQKLWTICCTIVVLLLLSSCGEVFERGQLNNVGLLLEGTIHDETWGKGAYLGVLNIKDEHNTSVITRENVTTLRETEEYVKDMKRQGVNLIFGHGAEFGKYFEQINEYYPNVHFVYFNGNSFDQNITSIHFDGYEMGYFAGVLSAKMTDTKEIGVISAYQNQSEVQGFYEGVKDTDSSIDLHLRSVFNWYDEQRAMLFLNDLIDEGIDIVYPAGDGFNVPIIEKASEHNIQSIGYINDQYEIDPDTVLTSTIQDLEKIYLEVANQYDEGELTPGVISYSFDNEYIYLGRYGNEVPEGVREDINESINHYIETGRIVK